MAGLLITGASGYLGSELARRGPAAGTYLHNQPPAELERALQLDVTDAGAVLTAFHSVRPDCVIHTAYLQSGDGMRKVNVEGSKTVARAARHVGARLVHLSTDLVFDGSLGRPYTEEDEPNPVMEYGQQKLEAEHLVAEVAPDALIVRTSLIYGGQEPSPPELFALNEGATLFTDELRSPVQVGDLAAALLELAASTATGVLHVAGADGLSRHEFARLVAMKAGQDPDALGTGLAADHPDPRPLDCRLDSGRAAGLLSVRLRGATEVLA